MRWRQDIRKFSVIVVGVGGIGSVAAGIVYEALSY
jgi:tRNA A37 threonylcarbamoyladenosine dehydratase